MGWLKLDENRERVRQALLDGYVDEVVTCQATAFDELAAAMHAFGYWDQLEEIEIELEKDEDDVPNELLLRELAVMPLLRIPNPHQVPTYLFQDPGILRFLGFTVAQMRDGFNDKGRRGEGARMRPHHRDTLYNALKAIKVESLADFRGAHTAAFVNHGVLGGGIFAVDGTGLRNSDYHVVTLQQIGSEVPPFIVDWRVKGPGQELAAGREMVTELQEVLGTEAIQWLLMDGAYVDGGWLARLQQQGIGAMVRIRKDMRVLEEMRALLRTEEYAYEPYEYVRTIQGHQEVHEVELAVFEDLLLWNSYCDTWADSDLPEAEWPGLWGVLVREEREDEGGHPETVEWGLVATKPLESGPAAFNHWRMRWDIENKGFRELNQGGWLESQTWGRSDAAIQTSIALTIGAHNCYCLMRTDLGEELAVTGLRDLQQHLYGSPPQIMVVAEGSYGLFTAEEFAALQGIDIGERLNPS